MPIPRSYLFLFEFFRHLDNIVCMHHNRQQKITAMQAAAQVQQATRRKFGEQHLKQIR